MNMRLLGPMDCMKKQKMSVAEIPVRDKLLLDFLAKCSVSEQWLVD